MIADNLKVGDIVIRIRLHGYIRPIKQCITENNHTRKVKHWYIAQIDSIEPNFIHAHILLPNSIGVNFHSDRFTLSNEIIRLATKKELEAWNLHKVL